MEKRVALSKLNACSPQAVGVTGHQQNGRRANAGYAKSTEWNRSQCEYHQQEGSAKAIDYDLSSSVEIFDTAFSVPYSPLSVLEKVDVKAMTKLEPKSNQKYCETSQ